MKLLKTLLILCFFTSLKAQKKKNYFPIWTFQQSDININGISVGIVTGIKDVENTSTNGIKIELVGSGILMPLLPKSPICDNDSLLFSTIVTEKINGANLSLTGTACACIVNGISAGYIGEILYKVNGASATLFMNFVQITNGLQIALFYSDNYKINGLQIAIYNRSKKAKGVQLGLFNSSEDLRGFQIGLWNKNGKRSLPVINWQFKKNNAIES